MEVKRLLDKEIKDKKENITMREYLMSYEESNKEGLWEIRVEYDDTPDNAMDAEIAYLMIVGPQEESFTYEFQFSYDVIRVPKHLLKSMDDRIMYARQNASHYINKKKYIDLLFTVQTSRTRVESIPKKQSPKAR